MPLPPRELTDRFFEKIDKNGPVPQHRPDLGPCWLWTASLDVGGYGRFRLSKAQAEQLGRKEMKAHRLAYWIAHGELPWPEADHLCSVRACVNPAHLGAVTGAENRRRSPSPNIIRHREGVCARGHPMTPENRYLKRNGGIGYCRPCRAEKRKAGIWK